MSEVTRYDGKIKHVGDGGYVSYKDYAELKEKFNFKQNLTEQVVALQKQRDALAAELANILEQAEHVYAAGYNHGHLNTVDGIAYEPGTKDEFYHNALQVLMEEETPATDAYLNSVRADVIKQLHSEQKEWALVTWQYDSFDALKRAAVRHGDSELSGVIFMLDRIEGFAAQLRAGEPS